MTAVDAAVPAGLPLRATSLQLAPLRVTQLRVARSEWTKFRSLRSTIYTLLAAVVFLVGLGAMFAAITARETLI